jgi:4'-phosphopantetheinyl transferase EntD
VKYDVLEIASDLDVLVARITECEPTLFEEEEIAIARAVEKRKREFAAGRNLAREALTRIGHAACAIPRIDRAPVWPDGAVGSISHSDELVAVCVAEARRYAGVGLDIEHVGRVTDDIEARILTPAELGDESIEDARTLRFACKEAIYKAVNPITGEYFGFQVVRIDLDASPHSSEGSFSAEPVADGSYSEYVRAGAGRFQVVKGHQLAVFYLGA